MQVIASSPEIPGSQFGAISFIQRFGTTLNLHPHFHLVVTDGVFETEDESCQFHEAHISPDDIADTQDNIRKRVLRLFARRGWIEKDEIEKIMTYENSGFSFDAKVRIEPWDREGLERLIRYCSRPCFASENLRWNGPWLHYRLPKPTHTGQTFVQLEPLDFLDRIAAFIPPPRRHRHHYHGVFAPNAPQRGLIAASANQTASSLTPPSVQETAKKTSVNWARLIARIYEVNPLLCTCGKEMKITTIVTHPGTIWRILSRIGWPTSIPDFDPPDDFTERCVSQLVVGTVDGFSAIESDYSQKGPDPPHSVHPQWENCRDPPHWEDPSYVIYE